MPIKNRREFLKTAACVAAGAGFALAPTASGAAAPASGDEPTIVGPKPGYSPEIGTLTSMMAFMRSQVVGSVKKLTLAELDFLLDPKANTVGAMLMHLAATETYYQLHTFEGMKWGEFPEAVEKKWKVASELGEAGRKELKGQEVGYYLGVLNETREKTLASFKKRDDKWLFAVDKDWFWGPTNNYCKWFHVCEHESHHAGQISLTLSKGR